MNSSPTNLYYLEGAVRPCAVRWLTNRSIVVCRTSGSLELQQDYHYSTSNLYRTGVGLCRLQSIPDSQALFVLGEGKFEVIRDGERGLTMNSGVLPPDLGPVGACVIPRFGLYVLASRDGEVWVSSDGSAWTSAGRLAIHEVTVGCAFSETRYAFGSAHGDVQVITLFPFSAKARQRLHADAVQDLFVLDEGTIGTVSRDRALRVWRLSETFELLWSVLNLHEHFINCAARVGDEIWTGSSDGTIALTSLVNRAKVDGFKAHADAVRTLDLSKDGARLISLSDDATYHVYDTQSRAVLRQYGEERQYIRSGDVLFHNDGVRIVFGSTSGFLHHGEIETGSFSKSRISAFSLRAMRHLNQTQILCGDETGALRIFDTVREEVSVSAPTGTGLTAIRMNPRDQTVLCGYRDGSIRVLLGSSVSELIGEKWQPVPSGADSGHNPALDPPSAGTPMNLGVTHRVHESIVGDVLPLPNGLIISCSDDHTIKTVILDPFSVLKTTSLDGTAINNLLVLSDLLVATTDGGIVFVLDVTTHELYGRYAGHASPVRASSKISDSLVATGDRLGEVHIWDVNTRETCSVHRFRERVIELGYEPRSQRLYVITESEVASLQLDTETFLAFDRRNIAAERNETVGMSAAQTRSGTVEGSQKEGGDAATQRVSPRPATIPALDDVEIARTGKPFQLSIAEDRLLRSFARWRGGTRCDLGLLSGGLSGARVFRAKVFDHSGATRINAVAKIGSRAAIQGEVDRYDTEISRLSSNATPRRLEAPDFSDESTAGVFYSLAEGYDRSEFQVALEALATVPHVVEYVARLTAPWRDRVPEARATIADVRRYILDDNKLRELANTYSLDWVEEFERRTVQIRRCTIHGDLHGGNILVDQHGTATIIDYGNVGNGSAPFDAITVEFSHLFHPDGPLRQSEWPKLAQTRMWRTEEYLVDSPMPELSRACWRWAESVCAGHREIAAAAYAYLIQQLKYRDTNKERILNLLIGVRTFYDST